MGERAAREGATKRVSLKSRSFEACMKPERPGRRPDPEKKNRRTLTRESRKGKEGGKTKAERKERLKKRQSLGRASASAPGLRKK